MKKQADYDTPWKDILDCFFQDFLEFAFPEIAAEIDWGRGYESLDKELSQISPNHATGKRIADKLMKVWQKNGEELWVLLHIEVQGNPEKTFPERLYIYNYRLSDQHGRPIVSIAILADNNPNWHPRSYQRSFWQNTLYFEFATFKLLDYADKEEWLKSNPNPFAMVVLAHLKALQTKKNLKERLRLKLILTRLLFKQGFGKKYIINLFKFIDWVMALPESFELEYRQELEQIEGIKRMAYITSIERIGIKKGMQQGERILLSRQLHRRFGLSFSGVYKKRLEEANTTQLLLWGDRILDAGSLDDVFQD